METPEKEGRHRAGTPHLSEQTHQAEWD